MLRESALALFLGTIPLFASAGGIPTVECSGCSRLQDFGNFGAAQLYQAVGISGPATGSDRVWVHNPRTARRAFVDVDTPVRMAMAYGITFPIPDLTRQEINVTWGDGSGSLVYELPVEVIEAIGDAVGAEWDVHADDPPASSGGDIPWQEFDGLPGFNGDPWRYLELNLNPYTLVNGGWVFSVQRLPDSPTPLVRVVECAWHDGC